MFVTSLHETHLKLKKYFCIKNYINTYILCLLFNNFIQGNESHEDGNFAFVHWNIHSHLKQSLGIVGSQ